MHQAQQVAIGADIIESVVMDTDVADVRRHVLYGIVTP